MGDVYVILIIGALGQVRFAITPEPEIGNFNLQPGESAVLLQCIEYRFGGG